MRVSIAFIFTLPLLAQESRFSYGVTGGVPLSGTGKSYFGYNNESPRFTVGPRFEYRFINHVSLIVNPLYRQVGNSNSFLDSNIPGSNEETLSYNFRTRGHNLSLPILGKYTFRSRQEKLRPFLTTGFSLHTTWLREEAAKAPAAPVLRGGLNPTGAVSSSQASYWVEVSNIDLDDTNSAPSSATPLLVLGNDPVKGRHQSDFLFSIRF